MSRKKESPTGVTSYFIKALQEKLHKSDKRAGEIFFNHFVVHAVFLKRGRAGGEKMPHLATRGGVLPFFLVHFANILIFK